MKPVFIHATLSGRDRRLRPLLLTLLFGSAVAAGCTTTEIPKDTPGRITVVATTTQMQDLVRNVGGRHVHLVGILKPNVDPHDFEPSPGTAIALAGAKLVVESGVGVDAWADRLVVGLGAGNAGDGRLARPAAAHRRLVRARAATRTGGTTRCCSSGRRWRWATGWPPSTPPTPRRYHANAARYVAADPADGRGQRRLIATVPPAERKLVTNHDAFGYFAAHYGITVVGSVLPSLSSVASPAPVTSSR